MQVETQLWIINKNNNNDQEAVTGLPSNLRNVKAAKLNDHSKRKNRISHMVE